MIKNWSFSVVLAVVYLAIFNLWKFLPRPGVVLSGIAITFLLLLLFMRAVKRRYFFNRWEATLHFVVIFDIFLEAVLPIDHHSRSFYLCLIAFAAVIGGYRIYLRKRVGLVRPVS